MFPFEISSQKPKKMMVYKVHLVRVISACVILLTLLSVVIFLCPPQPNCIRVSVSIQQRDTPTLDKTRPLLPISEGVNDVDVRPLLSKLLRFPIKKRVEDTKSPPISLPVVNSPRPFRFLDNTLSSSPPPATDKPPRSDKQQNTDAFFRTRIVHNDIEEDDNLENDEDAEINEDDYEDDELTDNKVFEVGDFDYNATNNRFDVASRIEKHSNDTAFYSSPKPMHSSRRNRNVSLVNIEGEPVVEDDIYWSEELEFIAPKGPDDFAVHQIFQKLRSGRVRRVESPTWNKCGRPKNQFVVFEDGSKACARYRAPHHYLVQGEVLSYHLSRLLGLRHVPVVALSSLWEEKWTGVKEQLVSDTEWEEGATVALIQWIDNLERDRLPTVLLQALSEQRSVFSGELLNLSVNSLVDLLQWTDLIIFDYITGNYDRVASMQDAADKEGKPSILSETVHNAVRSKDDGALWLIDNESGLLDAYALLYGGGQGDKFRTFHQRTLRSTCVFRRKTVENVRRLKGAGPDLKRRVVGEEPLLYGPLIDERVWDRLRERIEEVDAHFQQCESLSRRRD